MIHSSSLRVTSCSVCSHTYDRMTECFYLYGDSAYSGHADVMCPYAVCHTDDQQILNTLYSKLRIIVEHCFAKVVQYFAFSDFSKTQKIDLVPTAAYYRLSVLFSNLHSCIYSNQSAIR